MPGAWWMCIENYCRTIGCSTRLLSLLSEKRAALNTKASFHYFTNFDSEFQNDCHCQTLEASIESLENIYDYALPVDELSAKNSSVSVIKLSFLLCLKTTEAW